MIKDPIAVADWLDAMSKSVHYTKEWEYNQASSLIRTQSLQLDLAKDALKWIMTVNSELSPSYKSAERALKVMEEIG